MKISMGITYMRFSNNHNEENIDTMNKNTSIQGHTRLDKWECEQKEKIWQLQ